MNQIIKNHEIEQLTSATKIGLDKANVLDSTANLEAFLKARGVALEKKLLIKFQKKLPWHQEEKPTTWKSHKKWKYRKKCQKSKKLHLSNNEEKEEIKEEQRRKVQKKEKDHGRKNNCESRTFCVHVGSTIL